MKKSLYGSGRTGSLVNRDSINMKIFEEGGVGFGEGGGETFSERFSLPSPNNPQYYLFIPAEVLWAASKRRGRSLVPSSRYCICSCGMAFSSDERLK